MNCVGTEKRAPLHHTAIDGCVTPEVAKVERAFKAEVAVGVDGRECEICFVHESEATCNGWVHVDS